MAMGAPYCGTLFSGDAIKTNSANASFARMTDIAIMVFPLRSGRDLCIRGAVQTLPRFLTKSLCSILTLAETLHFTGRIGRGAATRPGGTPNLTKIILRAISHATLDIPILIPDRATSFPGTEHLAVLIRLALPFSAYYISILILDAVRGVDLGAGGQGQKAADKEFAFHGSSSLFSLSTGGCSALPLML
jgi:hypothetical protein